MILNSPYITGSLTVTGNTTLMGALTVTGSLSGTAATASFALTLGGTGSVGFATTGAFSATSGSASSRLTQIEQVYATTGSNSFRATQSITGSLTVTGQIIAQTLNVQQVTSSIVFSSGSNTFGCDLNSRQTFTGSVIMTGSLTVNTTGPELQVNNTGVVLGNLLTDNHSITGSLRVTGSVTGIGATFSGNTNNGSGAVFPRLQVENLLATQGDGSTTFNFSDIRVASGNSAVQMFMATSFAAGTWEPQGLINVSTNHPLVIRTNNTERTRITNGGDVFINNSCGVSLNGLTNKLSVSSTTYNLLDISRFSDNAFGPNFYLVKSRNGTIGGNTIVANGDNLGNITWVGATGGTGLTDAANIRAEVDGTPGTNDMPGRLLFSTTADGASSTTERMRIFSNGDVRINFNPGAGNGLYFNDSTNGAAMFYIVPAVYVGSAPYNSNRLIASNSSHISFETGGGERMRITSEGNQINYCNIFLNQTSVATVNANATSIGINGIYYMNRGSGSGLSHVILGNGGNVIGSISSNTTNAQFNTSSDYRLKKDLKNFNALNILSNIKLYDFAWKLNDLRMYGVMAHELKEILPYAVVGEKDELDENGNIKSQGVDYSLLTPVLAKAIQEQQCTICSQASIINALKTCLGIA